MGYMGFGLQKWISNLKPRKPFSKERKPSADTISNYHSKDLLIEGRIGESNSDFNNLVNERKRGLRIEFLLGIFFMLIFGLILTINGIKKWKINKESVINPIQKKELNDTYNLMISNGDNHINHKEYESAIKEYTQAIEINPNKLIARERLAYAYYKTCIDENQNCEHALELYKNLKKEKRTDLYIKRYAEIRAKIRQSEKVNKAFKEFNKN